MSKKKVYERNSVYCVRAIFSEDIKIFLITRLRSKKDTFGANAFERGYTVNTDLRRKRIMKILGEKFDAVKYDVMITLIPRR